MQSLNRRHRRSGTLWQGRYKSCLVDSERYLLCAYRYIELNPLRAGMVAKPEQYRWSSVHANLSLLADSLVTPHACFLALANTVPARTLIYRQLLDEGLNEDDLAALRTHVQQRKAWGDSRFQAMVAKTLGRPVQCRPIGRPRRSSVESNP